MNTKTKAPAPSPAKKPNGAVTWPQAVRDIFVTSMNRGQLPALGVIAILLVLVSKMPPEDAGNLLREIFAAVRAGDLWGYILCVGSLGGWFFHAKAMRKEFSEEALRIGRAKSELQGKLSGVKYDSSDRK